MDFRILGPLEVSTQGEPLDLGGQKQRALLAALLLQANRVVSQDRLIEALWEDDPPETAQKALQVYVSQLRKRLGKERLVTKSPGYLLRVEPDELDVERFQRLAEEGKLAEALFLWRGAALSDFAYQHFAQAETARLEELRLACLEGRIEDDLARGRHAELTGELEALVRDYPLRERLRGQLMLALYRSGRQAEALAAYQLARATLVEELGIEPSQDLRAVHQAILRQDPALKLAPASAALVEGGPAAGPFVGRERELGELSQAHDEAIAGRGRLVLLQGEPAIGKTRLLDELARRARRAGVRVLWGRCWEEGGAPAYWPWVQAIRGYVRESEPDRLGADLGPGAADLAQMLPELRQLLPDLGPAESLEGEGARFRLFDSIAAFLREASRTQPLLLVLDDVHAADEPSLLLLRFVGRQLGEGRILIVAAYRDVDPGPSPALASTVAELLREPVVQRLSLHGLSAGAIADFIREFAGVVPGPGLAAAIHAEADGNPLFVQEVVRLLAAEGKLEESIAEGELVIPQGVRDMIDRRLRGLSDECRSLLELAAVLGRDFGLVALERAAGTPIDELLARLDEATRARLVTELPGSLGRLHFAHALVRDVIYGELSAPRRMLLHKQAGEGLEQLYAGDPEPHVAELAHHFLQAVGAGLGDKAFEYARRAGDRALALLAYEEAARLYETALEALEFAAPADEKTRCDLLLSLGDVQARAGEMRAAKETFVRAAEIARALGSRERLGRAALGYGGRFPWLRAGHDRQLVPLLEEALAALGGEESGLRVRLLARLAGAFRDQPSLEPRSSLSREAVAMARRLGDPDTLGYALVSLATATWGPEIEELVPIAEEVSRLAEETRNRERAFQASWLHYISCMTRGDAARVAALANEHGALAEELKEPSQQWYSAVMRSCWTLLQGKFADAEQLAEEALLLGERAQSWDAGFAYRVILFALRREQGRLDEIGELIRRSVDQYAGYRSFRCLVPILEWELGREEVARRAFDELAAADFAKLPRDGEWLFGLSVLGDFAAHSDDRERAGILYELLLPYPGLNASAAGAVAIGSAARYLGLLASTLERWDEAAHHFEFALEMNERMGARPWLAHTQEDYGRMLLERGKTGRASELLAAALATYRELGMEMHATRAEGR
jgi:DNA-binding SARP family transcriptional activator/tetratricopeptide (TPR) repeat protein